MKMFPLLMLLPTLGCYGADETRGTTNQIADQELIRQVQSLRERGVTNVTEADLRRDPLIWITNAFLVHTAQMTRRLKLEFRRRKTMEAGVTLRGAVRA